MRFFIILLLFFFQCSFSQIVYESIESEALGTTRELKIQLPRNYELNSDQFHPLIVVFDGDYLFEVVAGNVDYISYWRDMPDAIVVGINQAKSRTEDTTLSVEDHLPYRSGAKFYNFIESELIDFLENKYRCSDFRIAIGHGETANYINYFFFQKSPIFNGFVALSPSFAPFVQENLIRKLSVEQKKQVKLFYYLSTASLDVKRNQKQAIELSYKISTIDNPSILYQFDNFEGLSHYSLVPRSIPNALDNIFSIYQPINRDEYEKNILTLVSSPVDYLVDKYEAIKEIFGVEKQILINDFKAIAAAIEKNKQYDFYKDLGNIAREHHPETVLGSYYLARFYEETGKPKKAMNAYRSSYTLGSIQGYSKDEMLDRADKIQKEIGD
jgi:predicted alpha/beta superfamily hydrolase